MRPHIKSYVIDVRALGKAYSTQLTEKNELRTFLSTLFPVASDTGLIRLGPNGDGGYLCLMTWTASKPVFHPASTRCPASRRMRRPRHEGVPDQGANHASWKRRLRGARSCGYRWPGHVNYFTPQTLAAMAQAAGLVVERMNLLDRFAFSDLYAVLRSPAR